MLPFATYFETQFFGWGKMERLRQLLQRGRNDNTILFCGTGLTGDCLNFDGDATLGVTSHLLDLLNDELKTHVNSPPTSKIKALALSALCPFLRLETR